MSVPNDIPAADNAEPAARRNAKPRFRLSSSFVRTMLGSHSIIGLTAAGLLYLVCVTGTFSVFYPDYERWEQPAAPETAAVDPQALDIAAATIMARQAKSPGYLFISLPTPDMPRVTVTAGEASRFVKSDGSLGPQVEHDWTHFIVELHYALTIPGIYGLTLVGILGIMLTAMAVSGLLSHPNIFKDAFSFRIGGAKRLQQVDLHNRLSVWSTPFQLMIALTGAFIGLSQLFLLIAASIFYNGDTQAASGAFGTREPTPTRIAAPLPDIGAILEKFSGARPDLKPMLITVYQPATTAQVVEVSALVPRRLVWSEMYRYDGAGNPLGSSGWSDGAAGVQVYASTYRLHFGHFAGLPMQVAYVLLGVAMCVVIASGVNIWLLRRSQKGRPAVRAEKIWTATVWGVPLTLAVVALDAISIGLNPIAVFWGLTLILVAGATLIEDRRLLSRRLRIGVAGFSALVPVAHAVKFGAAALNPGVLLVNMLWLALSVAVVLQLCLQSVAASAEPVNTKNPESIRRELANRRVRLTCLRRTRT